MAEVPIILRRVIEGHRRRSRMFDEKAFDPNQPRWPRGTPRAGQWRPKLGAQEPDRAANLRIASRSVQVAYEQLMNGPLSDRVDPEKLAELGRRIDGVATTFSTVKAYYKRSNAVQDEIRAVEAESEKLAEELDRRLQPMAVPREWANRAHEWARRDRAEREAIAAHIDQNIAKLTALQEEAYRLKGDQARARRDAIVGVLAQLRPMGGKLTTKAKLVEDAPANARETSQSMRAPGEVLQSTDANVREIQRLLPSAWISDMNRAGAAQFTIHRKSVRGWQRFDGNGIVLLREGEVAVRGDSEISLSVFHAPRTYLHEVAHRVQAVTSSDQMANGEAVRHQAEFNYLKRRTGSTGGPGPLVKHLMELRPGQGYEPIEMTIPDEFPHPYYGKIYGRGYRSEYNELLTMSLEDLYYGDLLFDDPETAQWALGILAAT